MVGARRPGPDAAFRAKRATEFPLRNPLLTSNAKEVRPWLFGQVPNVLRSDDATRRLRPPVRPI